MSEPALTANLHALATQLAAEPASGLRAGNHAERLAGLSLLADGVAEDLNNLFAPILMAAGLLGERLRDGHDRAVLAMLEDSARRGEALMRQIVALSGGQPVRHAVLRPAQVLEEVRRLVAETFPRAIDVVVEAGADAGGVRGELSELTQVLMTFCTIAREAMPAGGRLTLKSETVEVPQSPVETHDDEYDPTRNGRFVVLSVADTSLSSGVFRSGLMTQTSQAVTQARATAYAIVHAHGGFVDVATEVGRGVVVRIHLPAVSAVAPRHDVRPPAPPRGRDELVLVVDDEASVRSITAQVLRAFGYRIATATSGAEAVTLYARHGREISVVLLDMVTPVTDSVSTIHALRTVDPMVQIIAASASAGGGPALSGVAPSVAAFLPKPYTSADLLEIVRAVIDRHPVIANPSASPAF